MSNTLFFVANELVDSLIFHHWTQRSDHRPVLQHSGHGDPVTFFRLHLAMFGPNFFFPNRYFRHWERRIYALESSFFDVALNRTESRIANCAMRDEGDSRQVCEVCSTSLPSRGESKAEPDVAETSRRRNDSSCCKLYANRKRPQMLHTMLFVIVCIKWKIWPRTRAEYK